VRMPRFHGPLGALALAIVGMPWLDGCGGRTGLEVFQDGAIAGAGSVDLPADDASGASVDGSATSGGPTSGAPMAGGACASPSCTPMNATAADLPSSGQPGLSECHSGMILGWGWNGTQCVALVGGCSCVGSDCGCLLARRSACLARYAHCFADGG
jgi:hypothetical protein